jgi:hypothetical protein
MNDMKDFIKFRVNGGCVCNDTCAGEGTCRSFAIDSLEITNADLDGIATRAHAQTLPQDKVAIRRSDRSRQVLWGHDSRFDAFCLERILVCLRAHAQSAWRVTATQGYYGQEVGSIRMDMRIVESATTLFDKIMSMKSLDDKVSMLMEIEYGFLLDDLRSRSWSLRVVPRDKIYFPQQSHMERASRGTVYSERRPDAIMGLCIKEGDIYRVVDGYHRISQTHASRLTIITSND